MARFLPIFIAANVLAFAAGAAHADPAAANAITVSGEGTVHIPPDMALINLGVISSAKSAQDALAANAKATQTALAALKAAGVADKDLQTSDFSLQPEYETQPPGPPKIPVIAGYRAENFVLVTVRDIGQVGALLDKGTASGANSANGISFAVSDPAHALDEARQAAFADAKHKAEIYASAAGVKLGQLISLSDGVPGDNGPVMAKYGVAHAQMALPVQPGEETIQAHVIARFAVAP